MASNPRRKELIEYSNLVKPLVEQGICTTINQAIKTAIYSDIELNTFKGWKEKGYSVMKGEKALLLWGAPRKNKQEDAEESENETSFFPICYVFSINQVQKIQD